MTTPQFLPPEPGQPATREAVIQNPDRLAYLDAIDRRCAANNHTCTHAAKITYRLRRNGGDPYELKSCSRHQALFEHSAQYQILAKTSLGPVAPIDEATRDRFIRGQE